MTTKIRLKDMRFYAYHGVMEQEQIVGNQFVVNLEITAPLQQAIETDALDATINYAEVYETVKEQMNIPSLLLEHAAGRILKALKQRFPQITCLEVELAKLNPPFGGDILSASIALTESYN